MFVLRWIQNHRFFAATLVCSAGGLGVLYLWHSEWKKTKVKRSRADSINTVSLRSAHEFLDMWLKTFRKDPAGALFPVNAALESFAVHNCIEQKQLCAGILAICSHKLGEYDQAKKFARMWQRAFKETQKYGEDGGEILGILGEVLNRAGRFGDAEKVLILAQLLAKRSNDNYFLRNALKQLADAYLMIGNFQKCIQYCEECIPLSDDASLLRGNLLRTLGSSYCGAGNYNKGIQKLKESIEILKKLHPKQSHARAVGDLGVAYSRRNTGEDSLMAKQLLQRAEAECNEVNDNVGVGLYMTELARLSLRRNELNEALTKLKTALAIADNVSNKRLEAQALLCLAETQLTLGDFQDAGTHLDSVMTIAKRSGSRLLLDSARALNNRLLAESALDLSSSASSG